MTCFLYTCVVWYTNKTYFFKNTHTRKNLSRKYLSSDTLTDSSTSYLYTYTQFTLLLTLVRHISYIHIDMYMDNNIICWIKSREVFVRYAMILYHDNIAIS